MSQSIVNAGAFDRQTELDWHESEEEQNVEPTMKEARQPKLQIFHHPIEKEGSELKVAGFGWRH